MPIKGNYPHSTRNSTDTPLSAGETFTGEAESAGINNPVRSVSISVYSDVLSAFGGLAVEQSSNGADWIETHCWEVGANREVIETANITRRYYRVRYTTERTQNVFRLQTTAHETLKPEVNEPLDVQVANEEYNKQMVGRLEEILYELRILNKHQSMVTDAEFTLDDIEEKD